VEAADLSGEQDQEEMISVLTKKFPLSQFILTLGREGSIYFSKKQEPIFVLAQKVKAIDTTGAGDTFIGYFLAFWVEGLTIKKCLELASVASAICVTRKGAASSIPKREEVWQKK
jgi:ribokinase